MTTQLSFNLADQPWLPVIYLDGHRDLLSLRRLLDDAHLIHDLDVPSRHERAILIRTLIPFVGRSIETATGHGFTVEDWDRTWRQGHFDPTFTSNYLDQWRHRLDLFDPQQPFYQAADLSYAKDPKPVSELHPSHYQQRQVAYAAIEPGDAISAPLAARLLLLNQATTGFVRGADNSYLPAAWTGYLLIVLARADTLFHALLLNFVPAIGCQPNGRPAWEQGPTPPTRRMPEGQFDLFTFQFRRMRLVPDSDGRVRNAYVKAGDTLGDTLRRYKNAENRAMVAFEPHAHWLMEPDGIQAVSAFRGVASLPIWRGLSNYRKSDGPTPRAAVVSWVNDTRADHDAVAAAFRGWGHSSFAWVGKAMGRVDGERADDLDVALDTLEDETFLDELVAAVNDAVVAICGKTPDGKAKVDAETGEAAKKEAPISGVGETLAVISGNTPDARADYARPLLLHLDQQVRDLILSAPADPAAAVNALLADLRTYLYRALDEAIRATTPQTLSRVPGWRLPAIYKVINERTRKEPKEEETTHD